TGTRIERTEEMTLKALDVIKEAAGPKNVAISVAYVGVVPGSYPINSVYLWMSGPEEAIVRVGLRPGSGVRVEDLKAQLRRELGDRLGDWLRESVARDGVPRAEAAARARELQLSFEPADIVNEVMSFGSPTPIEIAVSGPVLEQNRVYADKVRERLARIPALRD